MYQKSWLKSEIGKISYVWKFTRWKHINTITIAINGTRGNRMCIDCWFNKFAMENKSHKCPGCNKEENRINKWY